MRSNVFAVLASALAAPALAQGIEVGLYSTCPGGDSGVVIVGGVWSNGCIPQPEGTATLVNGRVMLVVPYPYDQFSLCTFALTPWYSRAVVPGLTAGQHEVQLAYETHGQISPFVSLGSVEAAAQCVADLTGPQGYLWPDGAVTIDDLIVYLSLFEEGASIADVDDGSGTCTRDGGVTIDDLVHYLTRFEAGC